MQTPGPLWGNFQLPWGEKGPQGLEPETSQLGRASANEERVGIPSPWANYKLHLTNTELEREKAPTPFLPCGSEGILHPEGKSGTEGTGNRCVWIGGMRGRQMDHSWSPAPPGTTPPTPSPPTPGQMPSMQKGWKALPALLQVRSQGKGACLYQGEHLSGFLTGEDQCRDRSSSYWPLQLAKHLAKGVASSPKSLEALLHFIHFQATNWTFTQNIQCLPDRWQKSEQEMRHLSSASSTLCPAPPSPERCLVGAASLISTDSPFQTLLLH